MMKDADSLWCWTIVLFLLAEKSEALDGHWQEWEFGTNASKYKYKPNDWILIQHRMDESSDFYQKKDAYIDGFGDFGKWDAKGNFWLGLKKIHATTTDGKWELLLVIRWDTKKGGKRGSDHIILPGFKVESQMY